MFWTKMKTTAAALICAIAVVSEGGVLAFRLSADEPKPPAEPASAISEMGKLAASMAPGTWAELKTKNIVETIGSDGAGGALFGYSEGGAWDPATRQFLYVGGDHNGVAEFISYSADTNTWKRFPRPSWIPSTNNGSSTIHGYDHNAINPATGDFYHRQFGLNMVHKYRIATGTWSNLPPIATEDWLAGATGVEYYPELGGLIVVNGAGGKGSVYLFSEKTQGWSTLVSKLPMGQYHNFAEYSPAHKVMIFGGGHEDPGTLYKLDNAGKVTALKKPPIGLGIGKSIVTVDPIGGDFLVFGSNASFYAYDVIADSWKLQNGTVPFFSPTREGPIWQTNATPVSTYGVTMFVKFYRGEPSRAWVYLYKHSSPPKGKK